MSNNEIWVSVKGYEGKYEVSNIGNIRSLTRLNARGQKIKGKILSQHTDYLGYMHVKLSKNGIRKDYKVHRIVAMAFIENPNNLPEIDHINTIKNDNRVENLRWVTHKENCNNNITIKKYAENGKKTFLGKKHSDETKEKISNFRKGKFTYNDNPNSKKVICINDGKKYSSMKEAAEKYNVPASGISMCCKNKIENTKGYGFKYDLE